VSSNSIPPIGVSFSARSEVLQEEASHSHPCGLSSTLSSHGNHYSWVLLCRLWDNNPGNRTTMFPNGTTMLPFTQNRQILGSLDLCDTWLLQTPFEVSFELRRYIRKCSHFLFPQSMDGLGWNGIEPNSSNHHLPPLHCMARTFTLTNCQGCNHHHLQMSRPHHKAPINLIYWLIDLGV
jgi:hypothetical protein